MDGTFDGWCADPPNPFGFNVPYYANMSVSLEAPWTYLNYIVNNYQVGDISPTTEQPDSTCDIQQAIHHFLHGFSFCTSNINQDHIDEIVAVAQANGANFVPGCGQLLAVFLDAVDPTVQDQIILISVPCVPVVGEDTAWAFVEGATPFRTGWGWYFTYTTN